MIRIFPEIQSFVERLEFSKIPRERSQLLRQIADYLLEKKQKGEEIHLNFICTHNSRRSQFSQVWAQTAAAYFRLENMQFHSGGTEVTAFHPNAVQALKDSGFRVDRNDSLENPVYEVSYSRQADSIQCFSKSYHEALPNSESFVAILTCSDAEANCPFIPEAEARFLIAYNDPGEADGTSRQRQIYMERNKQIASEMFYLLSKINLNGVSEETQLS